MKTIAIVSQKGGVGKTTTAVTLGHALALDGRRVLIVDTDPQGQCATLLNQAHAPALYYWLADDVALEELVIDTGRPRLQLLADDKRTVEAQLILNYRGTTTEAIADKRPELEGLGVDVVLFDTAPSVGGLQDAAIMAADQVIVPVSCDYLSVEQAPATFETLATVQRRGWAGELALIQPTFYTARTTVASESHADLKRLVEDLGLAERLMSPIHECALFRAAAAEGQTIWEQTPRNRYEHRAQVQYIRLMQRLVDGVRPTTRIRNT